MAVNILLGAPGSGKSYEAVAFHVLPALAAGRKIITNLSLNLDELSKLDATYPALIERRETTRAVRPEFNAEKAQSLYQKFGIAAKPEYFNAVPFSHAEDYGDKWRHPDNGSGPLYVVDECHLALPSKGTPRSVEEWYSLHRHESADVLLISQSHSKINRAVVELIQTCYKVRKNTALGSDKSYRRSVHDGVRGEQANFSIRKYQSNFFKLYSSYTRGGGQEQAASDIVPIWKRPVFILMFISIVVAGIMVARASNPIKPKTVAISTEKNATSIPVRVDAVAVGSSVSPSDPGRKADKSDHALASYQIHQVGEIRIGTVSKLFYKLSRQGSVLFDVDSRQLVEMGYEVFRLEKCFSQIRHAGGWSVYASCDAPTQNAGLTDHSQPGSGGAGPATAGGAPPEAGASRVSSGQPSGAVAVAYR